MPDPMNSADRALVDLLTTLGSQGYHFITPTPLTHQRWLDNRNGREARSLREVFGWTMPFAPEMLPEPIGGLLREAGVMHEHADGLYRSGVRVSSLAGQLYLHSGYPTQEADAVFFGPDTYRFASFLQQELATHPPARGARVIDVGCGSGAGGLLTAALGEEPRLLLNDINPLALRYATINATAAGMAFEPSLGDWLTSERTPLDLVVCNPPYLVDDDSRVYRHGGDRLGRGLAIQIALEALPRLAPGGRLLLYTGVAMVEGRDPFIEDLRPALEACGGTWTYRELDPDVFGEELLRPIYAEIDRIAAVGLAVQMPA